MGIYWFNDRVHPIELHYNYLIDCRFVTMDVLNEIVQFLPASVLLIVLQKLNRLNCIKNDRIKNFYHLEKFKHL